MLEIRPIVLVGVGPQAQKTVQRYVRLVGERRGNHVPALLPAIVTYSPRETSFRHKRDGIEHITLARPVFDTESEWPSWLPPELGQLSPAQREGTRAWMRAALLQRMDDLQDFWLDNIPRLLSFAAVERLAEQGLQVRPQVYVVGHHRGRGSHWWLRRSGGESRCDHEPGDEDRSQGRAQPGEPSRPA